MNAIQKATFAASAVAVTCLGAALVTAPLAFARPITVVAQSDCATPGLQLNQGAHAGCSGFAGGAGLLALNRR